MKISETIRGYRKKENLTQEQVANYLNISAPAVNKWENGISYPDITLLSPLARILKIDVNTLLAFNEDLTEDEINKFGRDIGEIASKEGYEKAFEKASDLIKQYPNCDDLVYRIVTVLRIYLLALKTEEKDKYERKIIVWLELVAASDKPKISSMAKLDLSAMYRDKKDYEKAQRILDEIPDIGLKTYKRIQQALLFETSEKFDDAYGVYEEILFENAHEVLGTLSLIIRLLVKENKLDEAEEYTEVAKKLVEAFDLGAYHIYTLDLYLSKEKQDKERTIKIIIDMMNEAESMNSALKSKLYKHREYNRKYHDTKSLSKEKCEELLKQSIKKDKTLDFVKNDSRIKFLLQ